VGARLGANAEIVEHGVDGLLASGDQDYVEIIERLIADRGLRERIGRAGRKKVEERYSLQVQARVFRSVLERATRCPAKIVVVTTSPLALRAFFQSQVPFLVSRGFDVLAVSSPGPELHEFQAATGIPVRAVPMKRQISPVSDLVALWRMCSVLRQYRPTMVHAHTPKAGLLAMIAAWLTGVKLRLYTIHGLPLTTRSGWRFQLLRLAERLTCTLATEVHGVSPSVEQATTGLRICSKEKIRTLGHGSCAGVSLEKFDPAVYRQADRERIRARHGIPEAALVLGYIGRLAGDKGIRELAAAWRRLREEFPDLHLLCCGEFEPQDPVPAQAREMLQNDPRVHFSDGFVSEMPPVYAAIDVCVLPTYREGLPTVALESAAMEIPMVATRVTGCVDAIRDGVTGLLVEPRDPDALADAVSRLLRDPGLRKEMGRAAREFVAARFSEQRVFDLLLGEYRRLLAERGLQPLPCET
jgi:glycosyltransferase involved in cell wall biosynthesis